jgi:polysaccharide biosynthesis/export protein
MLVSKKGIWSLLAVLACTGCHSLPKEQPIQYISQPAGVPRELCKATIPDYIIEPPDVLTIEAVRTLPRQPYLLQSLDSMSVQIVDSAGETVYEATVSIDPSGELPLGPGFGTIRAAGLTVSELRRDVLAKVSKVFPNPLVSVDIVQLALLQRIAGEHLVGPDGRVNLGVYGQVRVAGMSIEEATLAIEKHLETYLENPKIAINVYGYNSKFYYVIAEGAGLGDQVNRFPYTGNETVLDAISNVEGFSAVSSKQMWIARPGRNSDGGEQILPVDWLAISKRGDVKTNYQLLPGDRIFVAEDNMVAYDNHLAKKLAPMERIAGVTLLITQAAQRLIYFDRAGTGVNAGGF